MAIEEKEYKKSFDIKIWAKMLPFIKPFKRKMIITIVMMLCCALVDILIPLMQSYAINTFITPRQTEGLGIFAVIGMSILAIQVVFVVLFSFCAMAIEMGVGRDLKNSAFLKLQKLSFSYYNTTPVGYIMARVMSDTNRIGGMVAWGLVDIMWALSYVVGVFIAMFFLNVKLALLVVTVVPAIAIVTVIFQKKMLVLNRHIRKINSKITGSYNEGITGARTSKTLVIEEENSKDFAVETQTMYKSTMKMTMLNAAFIPIILFFGSLASAFVLNTGGYMVMGEVINLGVLSAFVAYATGIFEPIQQIARIFADFVTIQANIERVTELLEQVPDIVDSDEVTEKYGDSFDPKRENWEEIKGDIEFKDIWFKYPDGEDYILKDFNLKIPAGTTVAIVGETGAGKSTLVNLACRFFEPTRGQVLIDGRDYRERSQLWLHSNIGYVLQNPHLFSGSVRDNIAYAKLDATDAEIKVAAKLVAADAVVTKMSEGYFSDVGEGGDKLSTGEKQLISFARAILANPRIFVLDEATSSIDTETEQLIQNAISHILHNRTSFLIAHRLSTIRMADIILVVKDGDVIERGTHKELIEKRGYYYLLYTKQFEEDITDAQIK